MALSLVFVSTLSAAAPAAAPSKILDNELVISAIGDDGQISSMQVLNHMRVFGDGSYAIQDSSRFKLSSVRNLYGSEKVVMGDGKLNLNFASSEAGFSDLYYLAQLDQGEIANVKMPVSIKLEYYLDGKQVKPSEIAGKDGHIKIVCQVENLTGEKKMVQLKDAEGQPVEKEMMVYTPYAVSLSGWQFDNDMFANIEAPGVAGKSPEGVIANIQGISQVSWTLPLIPPKYPAQQYAVLEADGRNIELPSFNIAVMPVLPTSSEADLTTSSLQALYNGFDKIQQGVGAANKNATLAFGLAKVKDGVTQITGGLASLEANLIKIRVGLANPKFDSSSYSTASGADANGATPGAKDAVSLMKSTVDAKLIPAFSFQKMMLGTMQSSIGTSADSGQVPSADTSIYNDINYLKTAMAGTPAQQYIGVIETKLQAMNTNVVSLRDGSSTFPASVTALELGGKMLSDSLGKVEGGLTMMQIGLGALDENGEPMKVMVNGKPGSVLYALDYLQQSINGQLIPGITQLQDGVGQIGSGAGDAKDQLAAGMATSPALMSIMEENLTKADTFLGKPDGAQSTVTYVFQTPAVSKSANAQKYGLGAIAVALILLIAVGRPPKQAFEATAEHV